jgi:uncharacterized membrane protein YdjX (TVP38/TMEM64 family)
MSGRSQLRNLDAALGRDGWRWFACCASPLTPLVATRFPLGLSAVSLRDYMLGALAALPALLGYVSLGASARAGLLAARPFQWALLAAGFAATVLAVAHVGRSSPRLRTERQRRRPDAKRVAAASTNE